MPQTLKETIQNHTYYPNPFAKVILDFLKKLASQPKSENQEKSPISTTPPSLPPNNNQI